MLLVMELCECGSLAVALEAGDTAVWPLRAKLRAGAELASGLAFLHAHAPPVVHRDLKPDNVLLDARGRCKLCDLGLSRLVDTDASMTAAVARQVDSKRHVAAPRGRATCAAPLQMQPLSPTLASPGGLG